MSPPAWRTPAILLITSPPQTDAATLKSSTADAVVAATGNEQIPLSVIATARPDLPVILLVDVDEQEELSLVAQGADQVLPSTASVGEIARTVRLAIARRSRNGSPRKPVPATPAFADAPQLQAIARLSGGIAHEFNNLLTVIAGNVEHLVQGLDESNGLREAASGIGSAAREAAVLTRQLLAFGRQQTLMLTPVDLNALIHDAMPLLRAALGDSVQVRTELASGLPMVRLDRDQMTEVLSNLAVTAADAMPAGGSFTILTDVHMVTDEERRIRPWLPDGRFLRIRLRDNGLGMEEQVLPHLFEPFFSGVPTTRGKGLAMSSVYGIVKQSGGYIWVDSRVNTGTTVTVLLPALETAARPASHDAAAKSKLRVLMVEDTDAVRHTLTTMLEWHGFTVASAGTAEEALAQARAGRFDVLLTDVALPEMSGPAFAAEFRALSPGTPVIFMSGYTANSIDPRDLDTPRAFLQKPFPVQMLVDRIHEMIAWATERRGGSSVVR
jgi:signal transduction histidine kinase